MESLFQITGKCQDCDYWENGEYPSAAAAKKVMAAAKAHVARNKHNVTINVVVNLHLQNKPAGA